MHYLSKPDISSHAILHNCRDNSIKKIRTQLELADPFLSDVSNLYESKMNLLEGHELLEFSETRQDVIDEKRLNLLYKNNLVADVGSARQIYDKLLARSKKLGCCFCSYEDSVELDHFLPKSKYAQFSINPINLVPTCHRCNKLKGIYAPNTKSENLIHPYFECFDDVEWLEVDLRFMDNTPVAHYIVSADNLNEEEYSRLKNHLGELGLFKRYSTQAAREFSSTEKKLKDLYEDKGVDAVIRDLKETELSKAHFHLNSWQSALYRALSKNHKFVNMDWSID